ncbi:MAG: peptidylprolyl isomerase [Candidatus Limiplasma sp.]|nr:peptidylprolyl isomerase [Candidatus Limiplasma sp.]
MKKILSLLLCLCLLFSAAALAEDTAAAELQDTDVLATVNGTELTWADVAPVYDSLVSSYGNYYDLTDSANVELFRAVAMQNKINEVIMQAKIAELGIALTDEEAAAAEEDAQSDWDNAISSYISQQHSDLTDESSQEDKDAANAEAVQYFNDLGYSPESLKENYKQYALYDKLEATIVQDVTVTDEEVEALYQELVESDRALYENDIAAYVDYNNYVDQMAMYAMYYGTDSSMDYAWYRPAGFRAVKHILLPVDAELMQTYQDLQARLEEQVESETEGDEESAAAAAATEETADAEATAEPTEEPVTQEQVDEAKAAILASIADKIDEIYAKIEEGVDFDELIAEYGVNEDGTASDPGMTSEPYKTSGYEVSSASTNYVAPFVEAAFSVDNVGDVSAPYISSYGVHIVKYIADIPAGPIEMTEAQREAKRTELLTSKQNELYTATMDQWNQEADITYTGLTPSYADIEAREAAAAEEAAATADDTAADDTTADEGTTDGE